jgi:hypothetical protein
VKATLIENQMLLACEVEHSVCVYDDDDNELRLLWLPENNLQFGIWTKGKNLHKTSKRISTVAASPTLLSAVH